MLSFKDRGGLSQARRQNPVLAPGVVSLDNRDALQLLQVAQQLATEIGFGDFLPGSLQGQQALVSYLEKVQLLSDEMVSTQAKNLEQLATELQAGQEQQDKGSEPDIGANVQPHLQLFLSFLQLLKGAQQGFNQLTARQMNFYYQRVLKFGHQPAKPDSVYLTFELEPGVQSCVLNKGVLLSAPGDNTQPPLHYSLDKSLTVNQTAIEEIRQVAAGSQRVNIQYDAKRDKRFVPFNLFSRGEPDIDLQSEGGYSMATRYLYSGLLRLQQGKRTITVDFDPEKKNSGIVNPGDIAVAVSTDNGWVAIQETNPEGEQETNTASFCIKENILTITLATGFPGVVPLPNAAQQSALPGIRLIPVKEIDIPAKVGLSVEVLGLTDLSCKNEQQRLDSLSTFEPFGFEPSAGASFYFFNREICSKPLSELTLQGEWVPAAVANKGDYPDLNRVYAYYPAGANTSPEGRSGPQTIGETFYPKDAKDPGDYISTFKVALFWRTTQGVCLPVGDEQALFSALTFPVPEQAQGSQSEQATEYQQATAFSDNWNSYYQLKLTAGDFLYAEYFIAQNQQAGYTGQIAGIDTQIALLQSQQAMTTDQEIGEQIQAQIDALDTNRNNSAGKLGVVYPPYTPALRPLSVNYKTQQQTCTLQYVDEVGNWQQMGDSVPTSGATSSVIIKLSPAKTGERLTLLLKRDGYRLNQFSASNSTIALQDAGTGAINWQYYVDNSWQPIGVECIDINPECDTLLYQLVIPIDIQEEVLWLKASFEPLENWPDTELLYIHTQAARATYVLSESTRPQHLDLGLAAGQIKNFVVQQPDIAEVSQPFASFAGRSRQRDEQLNTYASERLSNRHRALTISDYETLVLAEFPQIAEVRCIPAMLQEFVNTEPATVILEIIVERNEHSLVDNLIYPKADSQLCQTVADYIKNLTSALVNIKVVNPEIQPVSVALWVEFSDLSTSQNYRQLLQREIERILTRALLTSKGLPGFGRNIQTQMLSRQLVSIPYIRQIKHLRLTGIPSDQPGYRPVVYVPALAKNYQINLINSQGETP